MDMEGWVCIIDRIDWDLNIMFWKLSIYFLGYCWHLEGSHPGAEARQKALQEAVGLRKKLHIYNLVLFVFLLMQNNINSDSGSIWERFEDLKMSEALNQIAYSCIPSSLPFCVQTSKSGQITEMLILNLIVVRWNEMQIDATWYNCIVGCFWFAPV